MELLTSDGATLHYDERGSGPPLFLLHGFFGAGGDWAPFLDGLGRGRRLVVPDLRGHGRSTNPSPDFTHRRCAEDLLALADHLRIDRFAAVGLSAGGNTLLHAATRAPDRVTAMALVSATTHFPPQARAIQRDFTLELLGAEAAAATRARHPGGDAQLAKLVAHARAFADDHHDLAFTADRLATVAARTLVVAGDRDPLYPVEIAVSIFRAIPRASLWIIPAAGHAPIFGPHAARFVDEVGALLR